MLYQNKWNGNLYSVKSEDGANITLIREDKSEFTIEKKEFHFSYKKVEKSEKSC